MAKLPEIDQKAWEIRRMIQYGKTDEARRAVLHHIRSGTATRRTVDIASELLDPPKRGVGRPPTAWPEDWYKIGNMVQQRRQRDEKKLSYEATYAEVAEELGIGEETVKEKSNFYRAAVKEAARIAEE